MTDPAPSQHAARTPNRLSQETSPYLRQHADNPVDWHAWGKEALALAREQDKPILLSIGYSACHWCHVMAHESFEDAETARVMNELFINIKVDREERPDLDQIYQAAHGLLTQRNGGWPLTMFLMPDQTPYYAGTYFPKTARYGMPGFRDVLTQVAAAYRTQRADIDLQNTQLRAALNGMMPPSAPNIALTPAPLDQALHALKQSFDEEYGGLGDAPKFPHPVEFAFCLQRATDTGNEYVRDMTLRTLTHMAEGGIYDQLGGGFCRYSVDRQWAIPHFEKMLYDNALLLALYSDAWRARPDALYARTVEDTAAWVLREMQAPLAEGGGYYSSLDADSEHEEGKFYVWSRDEIRAALSAQEYAVIEPHYGLDARANFERTHWNLHVARPLADVASTLGLTPEAAQALLDSACTKLLALRAQRVRPGRDDKILTAWNALMIKGMARAARTFDRADWRASARAGADFVREHLWRGGRLCATHKDGISHLNAYLDDYAFMLDALLELMQDEFRPADLDWTRALADVLLAQFEDVTHGGFFFTSHDHEALIQRTRTAHDGALPSGNAVAAHALQRLGHLLGETRYMDAAARVLRAFRPQLERAAAGHTGLCMALDEYLMPPTIALLRGESSLTAVWQHAAAGRYLPHALIMALPADMNGLPATMTKPAPGAWVCRGTQCLPAIDNTAVLLATLAMRSN